MPPTCNCCETVPKTVPTINITSSTITATNALTLTVVNTGAATGNKTVTFQVIDSDGADVDNNFRIRVWFVDTNNKEAQLAEVVPTTPGSAELDIVTDDDGSYTLTVAHTGALDEWYVCAELLGLVYIDGPLNLGV